eukprot:scaffold1295_cov220-Pinguiococcus_pyrenoidosus.AAC.16
MPHHRGAGHLETRRVEGRPIVEGLGRSRGEPQGNARDGKRGEHGDKPVLDAAAPRLPKVGHRKLGLPRLLDARGSSAVSSCDAELIGLQLVRFGSAEGVASGLVDELSAQALGVVRAAHGACDGRRADRSVRVAGVAIPLGCAADHEVARLAACFAREVLRRLFGDVPAGAKGGSESRILDAVIFGSRKACGRGRRRGGRNGTAVRVAAEIVHGITRAGLHRRGGDGAVRWAGRRRWAALARDILEDLVVCVGWHQLVDGPLPRLRELFFVLRTLTAVEGQRALVHLLKLGAVPPAR